MDLLVTIARGAGAALDVVVTGAAWTAGWSAEKLLGTLGGSVIEGPWRGRVGSTDGAARVLRWAGVIGRVDRATASTSSTPWSSVPRTQIVEDDPVKRGYVERLCRAYGHAVRVHADPEAAWEALRQGPPSLILVGGSFAAALGFCRRLLGHEDRGAAVIVVIDWQGGRDHERAARAAGADDYLNTPADVDWLRLRLESVAEKVRRRATTRAAAERQEAMWTDLAKRVADAYAEQQATETTLRRALSEWSSAEEGIRRALAEIDRQVADKAGRLRAVEDAVAASAAARQPRGGESLAMAPALGESLHRREIRIPVDAIPSLTPEDRALASTEREHLRLVKVVPDEGPGTAGMPGAPGILGQPATAGDPGERERSVRGVPFALRGAVRTALEPLRQRAHQKKIGFGCHVAPDVPEGVIGDGGRFAQLLVHVVGHAIRSTDQGEVRVCVGLGAQASPALVLLGSVADSSPGLAAEEQKRLFDALGREDEPVRSASTVAGLALAGHLVRSMGGRIWFESEVEHGTTVRFTMRLGVRTGLGCSDAGDATDQSRPPRHRPGSAAATGLDVLVVDDAPADRVEATRVLAERGHRVVAVSEGWEAPGVVVAGSFDVVLVNLRMPKMDGFELAAVLRALEGRRGRRLPIVGLTAMLLPGDPERCAAVGIDICLRKPIDGDDLLESIVRLLSHPQRHSVPESA